MDQFMVLQYRRGQRRFQIIIFPYSFNVSLACLFRFTSARAKPDPIKGWRAMPINGMRKTVRVTDLPDFVSDAALDEVFRNQWFEDPSKLVLEAKGLVDSQAWDMGDLVGQRIPRSILTRVGETVDNWA